MRSKMIPQGFSVGKPSISELKKLPKRTKAAVRAPGIATRETSHI